MNRPFRASASYNVAVGSASAVSANPVPTGIMAVRLVSTTACYVAIGVSPTAATAGLMLAPNFPEVFLIRPGESVAAIQVSAAGTLNITELTS